MSENVFLDLGFNPEAAADLQARSILISAIDEHIRAQRWTQGEAADRLDVAQSRVNDLMQGHIDLFGLNELLGMAARLGIAARESVLPIS